MFKHRTGMETHFTVNANIRVTAKQKKILEIIAKKNDKATLNGCNCAKACEILIQKFLDNFDNETARIEYDAK